MTKSVLIIEDHQIYRDALVVFIGSLIGNANVVGVASTEEALTYAKTANNLRLIMLDMALPGINGAEAVRTLRQKCNTADIIVVSASEERREIDAVLRAGAKAFISKSVANTVIAELIQKILDEVPLESNWYTHKGSQTVPEEQAVKLTTRQNETLVFLCMGLPNKEIALRLGLSEITVKMHITSIFRALGVVNRTQAALAARRLRIFDFEEAALA